MPDKTHTTEPAQTRAPRTRTSGALTAADVLAVQRSAGNRAAQQLIAQRRLQARLTVGPVDDPFEREADRMADAVLSAPSPHWGEGRGEGFNASPLPSGEGLGVGNDAGLKREATPEEDDLQTKPLAAQITPLAQREAMPEEDDEVQRQTEEEDELAQTKRSMNPTPNPSPRGRGEIVQRNSDGSFDAGADVEQRIARSKGAGSPLPDATRAEMESKFGADFSGVRVHAGSEAEQLNRDLSAQAFTHGSDVYFGAGQFSPAGGEGKHLLAHELTHVVQQNMRNVNSTGIERKEQKQSRGSKGEKVQIDIGPFEIYGHQPKSLIQLAELVQRQMKLSIAELKNSAFTSLFRFEKYARAQIKSYEKEQKNKNLFRDFIIDATPFLLKELPYIEFIALSVDWTYKLKEYLSSELNNLEDAIAEPASAVITWIDVCLSSKEVIVDKAIAGALSRADRLDFSSHDPIEAKLFDNLSSDPAAVDQRLKLFGIPDKGASQEFQVLLYEHLTKFFLTVLNQVKLNNAIDEHPHSLGKVGYVPNEATKSYWDKATETQTKQEVDNYQADLKKDRSKKLK